MSDQHPHAGAEGESGGAGLLPCPFCGGAAWILTYPSPPPLQRAQCRACGVDTGGCDTAAQAARIWNRRASSTSAAACAQAAPAPSAPGAGGGLTAEELDRAESEASDCLDRRDLAEWTLRWADRLIAAARRAEPAAPAPAGGGGYILNAAQLEDIHRRAPTPDAPAKPGQGGEGAVDVHAIAHAAWELGLAFGVPGGRTTDIASTALRNRRRTEDVNRLIAAPPADAALRSLVAEIARQPMPGDDGYDDGFEANVLHVFTIKARNLLYGPPAAPADGAPEVEG